MWTLFQNIFSLMLNWKSVELECLRYCDVTRIQKEIFILTISIVSSTFIKIRIFRNTPLTDYFDKISHNYTLNFILHNKSKFRMLEKKFLISMKIAKRVKVNSGDVINSNI